MKYSIIIELEIDDYLTCGSIERDVEKTLKPWADHHQVEVRHLEAARGSLKDAFGIKVVAS